MHSRADVVEIVATFAIVLFLISLYNSILFWFLILDAMCSIHLYIFEQSRLREIWAQTAWARYIENEPSIVLSYNL
jgi:hypothetical protein